MPPKLAKRKSSKSPPSSPSRATSVTKSTKKKKQQGIKGNDLLKAYLHITQSVSDLEDRWFPAAELVRILPKYYGILKGKETECTTQAFTRAVNKVTPEDYTSISAHGIYRNHFGAPKQWYYLFTKKKSCPLQPTTTTFHFSTINDFINDVPNTSNNNNSTGGGGQKKSDAIRNESTFAQKETTLATRKQGRYLVICQNLT